MRISLKTALLFMMIGVALAAMLVFNGVYGNFADEAFLQMDLKLVTQNLTQARERLDQLAWNARELTDYVARTVLTSEEFDSASFARKVDPLVGVEPSISTVVLYDAGGRPVCATSKSGALITSQSVAGNDWFQEALVAQEAVFSGAFLERLYRGEYPWVVTVARRASYSHRGGTVQGVLAVNLYLREIRGILDGFTQPDAGFLMLADTNGSPIYTPRVRVMNLSALDRAYANVGARASQIKQLEISQPLTHCNWVLVGMISENQVSVGRTNLQNRGATALALSILIASLMAWLLSAFMARPFRYMEQTMAKIEGDVSDVRLQVRGFREFANMSHKYNKMIDRIGVLMRESQDKQEQLRRMEIATLQEQINPHFLYNALDSIVWLVETQRNADAICMIGALAKLMRLSMNKGGNFHTVQMELAHIENYLVIQKTRYGNRFKSVIQADPALLALACPRLILQPIVENAIKHGVADNEDCTICVDVQCTVDTLRITVRDDGMGIAPEKLAQVQQALRISASPRQEEISGLALRSVNRRLRLLCGAQYGLTIDSETEEWTCVTLTLPIKHSL